MSVGHLSKPPIVEVVCGVAFPSISGLDPVLLGGFWRNRRAEFPQRQLHPALTDGATLVLGNAPPARVWLLSEDGQFVVQLQHDRFYLNWRKRGERYPRFNTHDGSPGLLDRTLAEFARFGAFCSEELGRVPAPVRIELAKVDHLYKGEHWADFEELAAMLPWLGQFADFRRIDAPDFLIQYGERRPDGDLMVILATAIEPVAGASPRLMVKLETRRTVGVASLDELQTAFGTANNDVNGVFERMIETSKFARFGSQP